MDKYKVQRVVITIARMLDLDGYADNKSDRLLAENQTVHPSRDTEFQGQA